MDKYYTPDISEFHVGFEYETMYLQNYDTWKKEILDEDDVGYFQSIYSGDAVPTEFRVKYLSKEDIESLGWEFDKGMLNQLYNKDNWILIYNTENHRLSITVRDSSLNLEMMIKLRTTEVFNINIKNKSELIKLLKQLGIG